MIRILLGVNLVLLILNVIKLFLNHSWWGAALYGMAVVAVIFFFLKRFAY